MELDLEMTVKVSRACVDAAVILIDKAATLASK